MEFFDEVFNSIRELKAVKASVVAEACVSQGGKFRRMQVRYLIFEAWILKNGYGYSNGWYYPKHMLEAAQRIEKKQERKNVKRPGSNSSS